MLEAHGITVERGGRKLLDDVSIEIAPERVTAIVGPNGAGKSTLIKVLAGEIVATHGDVLLDGRNLKSFRAAELAARRAIVPQSTFLSFPFSVIEVVKLGASVPGFDQNPEHSARIADDALADVGLTDFRDRLFGQLSGGERQRVHVARALCQLNAGIRRQGETAVLLLDEPTSSLDLSHQSLVLGEARSQADEGRAVAVVLHDLNLAAAWADEIILLSSGRIAARGRPSDIFRDDLLSAVFGCPIRANVPPPAGTPYMLPHFLRSGSANAAHQAPKSSSKHRPIGYAEGPNGVAPARAIDRT